MLDPDERRLLGMASLAKLGEIFLLELEEHPDGLSPSQMHKLRPDVSHMDWVYAAVTLYKRGLLSHSWRPVKQPAAAAQESVFTKKYRADRA